ncbi:hypothetical protein CALCODRAFT_34888 [Calocera cornea HHB12733]|uniref:Secreted protein n=1 Tax=Calocera cornea HHB12733 TaxID=1353952 RepID=A0A165E093_9BASI|nr:hypothetical protein CALCODRAFT_34888 [Calocera cornea HHB12733]
MHARCCGCRILGLLEAATAQQPTSFPSGKSDERVETVGDDEASVEEQHKSISIQGWEARPGRAGLERYDREQRRTYLVGWRNGSHCLGHCIVLQVHYT